MLLLRIGKKVISFFNKGNGAEYIPEYGSYIVMSSRDRRATRDIFFTLIPGFENVNVPKHHQVEAVDEDVLGSSVAFFVCPKEHTLKLYEKVVFGGRVTLYYSAREMGS